MSLTLRIMLIVACLGTFIYIRRKIRQSKLKMDEAIFWIVFSLILLIMSLFPQIPAWIAFKIGFVSTVNLIYLVIIFLLIIKLFTMSRKVSDLEERLKQLVQNIAIKDNENQNQ